MIPVGGISFIVHLIIIAVFKVKGLSK